MPTRIQSRMALRCTAIGPIVGAVIRLALAAMPKVGVPHASFVSELTLQFQDSRTPGKRIATH